MMAVKVGEVTIGGGDLVLIAGPCIIESREHAYEMAAALKEITARLRVPFIFKASFDKANRSSIAGFRGPGLKEGLAILSGIKVDLDIPITTDIHEPSQGCSTSSRSLPSSAGRPISY
jgi:2-dehydro-3-deoxyphosphooctonate aldolase (KDO 8-P synthase)